MVAHVFFLIVHVSPLLATGGPGLFQFLPDEIIRLPLKELVVRTDIMGGYAVTRYDFNFGAPQGSSGLAKGEFLFSLAPGEELLTAHLQQVTSIRSGDSIWWERKSLHGRRSHGDLGTAHDKESLRFHKGWLAPSGHRMIRLGEITIPDNGIRIRLAVKHQFHFVSSDLIGEIPLRVDQEADTFKLEARVHDVDYIPIVRPHPNLKIRFSAYRGDFRTKVKVAKFRANHPVEILLPVEYDKPKIWYGKADSTTSFMVHLTTDEEGHRRRKPKKIALWWDSGSLTNMQVREKELQILDFYFRFLHNFEVEVIRLGFGGGDVQTFTVENGQWSELRAYLQEESISRPMEPLNWEEKLLDCEEAILCTHKPPSALLPLLSRIPFGKVPSTYVLHSAPQTLPAKEVERLKKAGAHIINLYGNGQHKVKTQLTQAIYQVLQIKANPRRIKKLNLGIGQDFPGTLNFTGAIHIKGTPLEIRAGTPVKKGEKFKMRLRPYSMVKIKSTLVDLITRGPSEQMVFPQTPDEYVQFGLNTPETWRLWVRPLVALKEREELIEQENIMDQIALRQDRLTDAWSDIQEWYSGKFDTSDVLSSPTPYEPIIVRKDGPELALKIFDLPRLFIGPDTSFGQKLPADIFFQAKTVQWLQAPHFRCHFGNHAEEGLWYVSSLPNDTRGDSLLLIPERPDEPPYLLGLDLLSNSELLSRFMDLRPVYVDNPSFYLDLSDQMVLRGMVNEAVNTLQLLPELGFNAPEILRAAGHRLLDWNRPHIASSIFAEVVRSHPSDPLSHRDLGLSLLACGQRKAAFTHLLSALKVDYRLFESRYLGVEEIVLRELNHLGDVIDENGIGTFEGIEEPMPVDLRVTLDWIRSDTDVDLWVTDPDGVTCNYDHPVTPMGGKLSGDVTNGYGPEEFVLRTAKNGVYTVEVEYEDDPESCINGINFIKVTIFLNYGKEDEQVTVIPLSLPRKAAKVEVAKIKIR